MRVSGQLRVAAVLISALILAACGSGGNEDAAETPDSATDTEATADDPGEDSTESATEPQELHSVRAGIASTSSLSAAPAMLLMADPSIAERHGLDAEWTSFGGDPTLCMTAVVSGDVDFCVVSPASGAFANAEGQDIRFIAAMTNPMSELVLSADYAEEKGVSLDAPLNERIAALEGATIATAALGSTHASYFQLLFDEVGLKWEQDVSHLTLTDPTAMMEGIRNGQFDGAIWSTGAMEPIIADGAGLRWIALATSDIPQFEGLPYVTTAAQGSWVDSNPDAVQAFNDAIAEAVSFIKDQPEDAGSLIKDEFLPDMEQALFDSAWEASVPLYNETAGVTKDAWTTVMEIYQTGSESADVVTANPFEEVVADAAKRP